MADDFTPLPDDDESPDALLTDAKDYLADAVPGWAPSDAALEVAILAAFADEGSTLYTLLRDRAKDEFRDFGADILGVQPADPTSAQTTLTWFSTAAAPTGGYLIAQGTQVVIDTGTAQVAFETTADATILATTTSIAGVPAQALEPGSAATGATGTVLFDAPPVWVDHVDVDYPATGGTDGEDDDTYLERVVRAAQQLSKAPVLARDFELAAQEIPGVARALVIDGYDDTAGTSGNDRTVSIYPVDEEGAALSAGLKSDVQDLIESRREVNWIVRVADPTYTTVAVAIVLTAEPGVDPVALDLAVQAAIADQALNPATWGNPLTGERLSWRQRTKVRLYEVSAVADRVPGVDFVESITLNGSAADVTLSGPAKLPTPGAITTTIHPAP